MCCLLLRQASVLFDEMSFSKFGCLSVLGAKRRQSPKGSSSHPNSGGVNGERKISASQSAFSNFAQSVVKLNSSIFYSRCWRENGLLNKPIKI